MSPFELSSCGYGHFFLAIFSPSSYSWNEWNVCHFSSSQPKQLNLVPVNGALTCKNAAIWRHFLAKHKSLPNLVVSNWLWWIKRVLLANQNRGNILKTNNGTFIYAHKYIIVIKSAFAPDSFYSKRYFAREFNTWRGRTNHQWTYRFSSFCSVLKGERNGTMARAYFS